MQFQPWREGFNRRLKREDRKNEEKERRVAEKWS
jgi:hypothetical protein